MRAPRIIIPASCGQEMGIKFFALISWMRDHKRAGEFSSSAAAAVDSNEADFFFLLYTGVVPDEDDEPIENYVGEG